MDRLYVFLIRNDVWIYILCALGLLWFTSEFLRSQGALSRAAFRLERETALLTRNRALFFMVLLGSIAATVAYVNIEVRPNLPPELLRPPTPTPEPGFGPQPTPTEEAEVTTVAPSPTSPLPPTVTLSEAEGGAPITDTETLTTTTPLDVTSQPPDEDDDEGQENEQPSQSPLASCTEDANITEPRPGATIRNTLNVFGTANTEDFAFYELEIRGPQTNDRWASLLGRTVETPVEEGILGGNLNLTEWAPGPYQLRLTITNSNGNITNQCSVDVRLDN
jgi:hypothetical protein